MATPPPGEPLVASIDSMTPPVIEEVPFSLFAQHERKTTNLINNSPNKITLKSQNRFYDFYFSEPLFINIIEIETQEFVESSRFEYYWIGIDDRKYEGDSSTHNNIISIEINGIAKSISIKPPKAYFTKPQIQCVKIFGFNISQAGDFIKFSDKLEKEKSDIVLSINRELSDLEKKRIEVSGLQAQRGTIQQDISSHKNSVAREQSKLKNLEIKKNELITQNGEFERSNVNLQLSIEKAKAESSKLAALRSNLSKSVQTKNSKLTALVSDIHLFPSELSGFSKQGAQDARTFFWLSFIPLILIVSMFFLLTRGSVDLTTKITGSEQINIAALIASRAPYVAVAGTIITVSYYIARMLVLEIIRISRQRLALTKISIIAKDISNSIDSDLNLTDDEKYQKRLILKMDMMKNHLSEYISNDFQPTIPDSISLSPDLLKRFGLMPKSEKAHSGSSDS